MPTEERMLVSLLNHFQLINRQLYYKYVEVDDLLLNNGIRILTFAFNANVGIWLRLEMEIESCVENA